MSRRNNNRRSWHCSDCIGCGTCQEFQEYNGEFDPADDHDEYGGIAWVGDEELFDENR